MANHDEMGIDTSRRNRIPRPLTDGERTRLEEFTDSIHYSSRYAPEIRKKKPGGTGQGTRDRQAADQQE